MCLFTDTCGLGVAEDSILLFAVSTCQPFSSEMISVTCPEALMGLSAMEFYIMRRDYPFLQRQCPFSSEAVLPFVPAVPTN